MGNTNAIKNATFNMSIVGNAVNPMERKKPIRKSSLKLSNDFASSTVLIWLLNKMPNTNAPRCDFNPTNSNRAPPVKVRKNPANTKFRHDHYAGVVYKEVV